MFLKLGKVGATRIISHKKYLITGGLGFVGRHLAERLSLRGDAVEVGDIHAQPTGEVAGSYVQADVTCLDSLRAAFAGKDVVFHVASLVQTKQANAETVWAVNLGGTQNVIEVCRELGVKRLVYVSSASVVYEGRNIENGDETLPYASSSQAPYADSKIAAEKAVLEAHDPDGLRTCAIRPHVVFGPGDGRFLPALSSGCRASTNQARSLARVIVLLTISPPR